MMYGTRQGQDEHRAYIGSHWREVDVAEGNYNDHAKFEQ